MGLYMFAYYINLGILSRVLISITSFILPVLKSNINIFTVLWTSKCISIKWFKLIIQSSILRILFFSAWKLFAYNLLPWFYFTFDVVVSRSLNVTFWIFVVRDHVCGGVKIHGFRANCNHARIAYLI